MCYHMSVHNIEGRKQSNQIETIVSAPPIAFVIG